jgi:hypothetical protein
MSKDRKRSSFNQSFWLAIAGIGLLGIFGLFFM